MAEEGREALKKKMIPDYLKFIFGGTAGVLATTLVHPLDLVKNRMQLSGEGSSARQSISNVISNILKQEGIIGFYNGLSAGMLRQATYTTTRLGIYTSLLERFSKGDQLPSFPVKASLGIVAGCIAAITVGTPADLCLVRMTADGRLPPEQRRGYKNVFDALYRIIKEEGVLTLWRGCTPTVIRAMVVNATQLATYSQAKELLLETKLLRDNIFCHICSSMISSLATVITSTPVDMAKTRMQNMKVIDGRPEYQNAFDVWAKVLKNEGLFALWKGFAPFYFRLGPHSVLIFVFLEQLNAAYFRLSR